MDARTLSSSFISDSELLSITGVGAASVGFSLTDRTILDGGGIKARR